MRIIFCASYPNLPIGYSRVARILANALAEVPGVELHYFGFSNGFNTSVARDMHPSIRMIDVAAEEHFATGGTGASLKDDFGVTIIGKYMESVRPDIVFIYNDLIVTSRLIVALNRFKDGIKDSNTNIVHPYRLVTYIDLVYPYERLGLLRNLDRHADQVMTFSQFWSDHLRSAGFPADKLHVTPHGIDPTSVWQVPRAVARRAIGAQPDDFIVLNTNRNAYRKMWDITIRAFLIFLKKNGCDPKIKLYVNCQIESNIGFSLLSLIETEAFRLGIDISRVMNAHIFHLPNPGDLTDEMVNNLYNAADVGINTAAGEGWGLCSAEGAAVGVPQIVSDVGGLHDIFINQPENRIAPAASIVAPNILDWHNGDLYICKAEDFAARLDHYFKHPEERARDGAAIRAHVLATYDYAKIVPEFLQALAL